LQKLDTYPCALKLRRCQIERSVGQGKLGFWNETGEPTLRCEELRRALDSQLGRGKADGVRKGCQQIVMRL